MRGIPHKDFRVIEKEKLIEDKKVPYPHSFRNNQKEIANPYFGKAMLK